VNDTRADYRVALRLYELVKALPLIILFAAGATVVLVGVSNVFAQLSGAERNRAALEMNSIGRALELYHAKTGELPSSREGLRALVEKRALDHMPADPWGNAYDYSLNADGAVLRSRGEDGRLGGRGVGDDIVVRIPRTQLEPDAER
jgi:general secretion pathway protein G